MENQANLCRKLAEKQKQREKLSFSEEDIEAPQIVREKHKLTFNELGAFQ